MKAVAISDRERRLEGLAAISKQTALDKRRKFDTETNSTAGERLKTALKDTFGTKK